MEHTHNPAAHPGGRQKLHEVQQRFTNDAAVHPRVQVLGRARHLQIQGNVAAAAHGRPRETTTRRGGVTCNSWGRTEVRTSSTGGCLSATWSCCS